MSRVANKGGKVFDCPDDWNFLPDCMGDAELAHEVASIIVGFDANKYYNGDPFWPQAETALATGLLLHLREQYGMVLESVAAGYAARHLIWRYVVGGMLRDEGFTPEQIMQRLEEDRRIWNAERDQAADLLEKAIRNLGINYEDGSGST